MDQERSVNKVLRDMKLFDLISKDITGEVRAGEARVFLDALWVAGYEHKTKVNACEKRVIQEDRDHKIIQEHPSMVVARRIVGMSKQGMINAIKNKLLTRKGYYFRYAEDENTGRSDNRE